MLGDNIKKMQSVCKAFYKSLNWKLIGKSLSTLGSVINGLYQQKKNLPYRDTILTRILKQPFSGDGKVLLVTNVSPTLSNIEEVCYHPTIS